MVTAVAFCWSVANKIKKKETLRYYNPPKKNTGSFFPKPENKLRELGKVKNWRKKEKKEKQHIPRKENKQTNKNMFCSEFDSDNESDTY